MIKRVLISVYEKRGLEQLLKTLSRYGVEVLSSGGTAEKIREFGFPVIDISEFTSYPEAPGGLIKTLHPKIHGGILLDSSNPYHLEYMRKQGIETIDMVVVNFYPLPMDIEHGRKELEEFAENIDIGGPAMVRAAAKAALLYSTPTVITEIDQYDPIIYEFEEKKGKISRETVRKLALQAFEKTRDYDEAVVSFLLSRIGDGSDGY